MLPDDFFASHNRNRPHFPRKMRERVEAAWRRAERFEFSPAASEVAGRLRYEAPALIVKHREFAIPPYTTMYIECDSRKFFTLSPKVENVAMEEVDKRLGYLIDGNDVFVFAGDHDDDNGMSPWFYRFGEDDDDLWKSGKHPLLGPEWPYARVRMETEDGLKLDYKLAKLVLLLGSGSMTKEARAAMDDIIGSVAVKAIIDINIISAEGMIRMLNGSAGDLANLWTFLLWLNKPANIKYVDRPRARRINRGKLKVYSAFRTVEIELGKFRSVPRAYLHGGPATPRRRHKVRGSFHHHGGLRVGCGHEYVAMIGRDKVWECQHCQRRRWWVKQHERCLLADGVVVHDYAVSAGDRTEERA